MTKPRPVCKITLASVRPLKTKGPKRVCYKGLVSDPHASNPFSFKGPPGLLDEGGGVGEFLARLLHGTDDGGANTLNFYWTTGFDVWDLDGSVQHITPKLSVEEACRIIDPIHRKDHLDEVLQPLPVESVRRPRM